MCAAFTAIQLGGYANQVIFQYPNGLTFYGGMAIVYLLPYLEPAWIEYEQQRLKEQEEKNARLIAQLHFEQWARATAERFDKENNGKE